MRELLEQIESRRAVVLEELSEIVQFDDDLLAIIEDDEEGARGLAEIREGLAEMPELLDEGLMMARHVSSQAGSLARAIGGGDSRAARWKREGKAERKAEKAKDKAKAKERAHEKPTALEKIKSGVAKVKGAIRKKLGMPAISGKDLKKVRKDMKDYAKLSDSRLYELSKEGDRKASSMLRSRKKRNVERKGTPKRGEPGTKQTTSRFVEKAWKKVRGG